MAGPSFFRALLLVLVVAGCGAATPEPVTRETREEAPPPATQQNAEPAPAPAPEPAAASASQETKPSRDDQPIVVDPGDDGEPKSLVEAARAEKERRANAGQSAHVINDKTLPGYARRGQITIADPKKDKKPVAGAPVTPAASEPGDIRDEAYWRNRARDIRERWRDAASDAKTLEQRATELRQKFYLEGDTFTRDNQIKPEWDRVLERLRQARLDVDSAQKELAEFLEEGRAKDVMPGWLREGEEEEPEELPQKKKEAGSPPQSIEPPVIEPPPAVVDPPLAMVSIGGWK